MKKKRFRVIETTAQRLNLQEVNRRQLKKEQRQPQISPDIDKTKEESQQLPTREQKLETKN